MSNGINEHSPLQTATQRNVEDLRAQYLLDGEGGAGDKLRSIMRFLSRQELAKILAYYKIFNETRGIAGSIADCGVFWGASLMTFANLSATLEPYNYQCKIFGFDTFEGDRSHSDVDFKFGFVDRTRFTYAANSYEDLKRSIDIFDKDRPLGHLPKVELIKGDLIETAESFIANHPEVIFRIICCSVNLYQPTISVLRSFWPRLSVGGALIIHGMNYTSGASEALLDYFGEISATDSTVASTKIRVDETYPNITFILK